MSSSWWPSTASHWVRTGVLVGLILGVAAIVIMLLQRPDSGTGGQEPSASGAETTVSEGASPTPSDAPTVATAAPSRPVTTPSESAAPSTPEPTTAPPTVEAIEIVDARIEVSNSDRFVAPGTIEAGRSPGFEPYVFTKDGRLERDDPCYVYWTVYANSDLVYTHHTPCEKQGSFSEAFWPSDLTVPPGTMRIVAEISTDWGASYTAELSLRVI